MKISGYVLIILSVLSAIGSFMKPQETDVLVQWMAWILRAIMFAGGLHLISKETKEPEENLPENYQPINTPTLIEKDAHPTKAAQITSQPTTIHINKAGSIAPKVWAHNLMSIVDTSALAFITKYQLKHNDKAGARFEAFLYFFQAAVHLLKIMLPTFLSEEIERQMSYQLFDMCAKVGLMNKLKPNAGQFIDDRLKMYENDLYSRLNNESWIMAQSIHAICFEPLKADITKDNCFLSSGEISEDTVMLPYAYSKFLTGAIEQFMVPLLAIIKRIEEVENSSSSSDSLNI